MVSVFIVEDNRSIQVMYEKILSLNGFEIAGIANNGEEAISMYKLFSKKPDIILMDHRMPIKDGIEATQEILKIDNSSKIIFASADETIKQKALSLGVISFKDKPFRINKLISNIKKALSSSNSSSR